jgi:hypothetical protein
MARGTRARRAAATLVVAGGVGAVSLGGCSEVLGIQADRYLAEAGPPESDASTMDAPVEAAPPPPPGWQCIDDPPPPPPTGTKQVKYLVNDVSGMHTSGSFVGTPVVGATLQACDRLDFQCQMPMSPTTTDDAGIAFLTVPGGFDGFYQVTANAYAPSLVVRAPQIHDEYSQMPLVSANTLALGEQVVGVMQDPNNAIGVATVQDCSSNPAPGVTVEIATPTPNEKLVYFQDTLPTTTATSTDKTGTAMIFNVPPGTLTVTAYLPGHRPIRTVSASMRAGWVTFVQVRLDQSDVLPL